MTTSVKMMIMCQLSDAQHMMAFDKERANYLINAAKIMLRDLDDKDVDEDEYEKKIVEQLNKLCKRD